MLNIISGKTIHPVTAVPGGYSKPLSEAEREELLPIRRAIKEFEPDIAFNLVEEFHGEAIYDQNVVAPLRRQWLLARRPHGMVSPSDFD